MSGKVQVPEMGVYPQVCLRESVQRFFFLSSFWILISCRLGLSHILLIIWGLSVLKIQLGKYIYVCV